jgi:subtilisin family serine protease
MKPTFSLNYLIKEVVGPMNSKVKSCTLLVLVLLAFFYRLTAADETAVWYEPGQIIVKLSPDAGKIGVEKKNGVMCLGLATLDRRMKRYGVHHISQIFPHKRSELGRIYQFDIDPRWDSRAAAGDFASDEHLLYAEPRYRYRPCAIPNDPFYQTGVQWYLAAVQAPQTWDITYGDSAVIIGIVDTGVDLDHPDLRDNLWVNLGEDANDDGRITIEDWNNIDDDGNGYVDDLQGWNFGASPLCDPGSPWEDNVIHGTHMAGIAAAVTDNNTGVAGMSWNCTFMAVKVCRDGQSDLIYGFEGIQYAADNGARVINLGWARGDTASAFEQEIIDSAFVKGVILVAAAGNDPGVTPPDSCPLSYPAGYDHVTAVAATDVDDKALSWTYYGSWVDVAAPGEAIYNTWWNDSYVLLQGTSRSCALVSGVAALLKVVEPEMNSDQFQERVRTTSDDIDAMNPGFEGLLGGGRINAYRALMNIVSEREEGFGTETLPNACALHQNYPNPFNAATEIGYQIPRAGRVTLKVFNALGQEVRTLLDGRQEAGEHKIRWDGQDANGQDVASGLYFCRMEVGKFRKTVKMVLVR